MFPPCEMMVRDFLPNVRGVMIHRLRKNGHSQLAIAKLLGITQAAVSQSLRRSESFYQRKLQQMGISAEEIELLSKLLQEDLLESPERSNGTLYAFWRKLLGDGRLCEYHRTLYPQLASCEICMTPISAEALDAKRLDVIRQLEEAVKSIERSPFFSNIMPEVSVNIVYSVDNPQTTADIAAIPGRIVKVGERVQAVGKPVFGASQHMANVLLAVSAVDKRVRAAINLRNDQGMKEIVKSLNIHSQVIEPSRAELSEDDVIRSVANAYARLKTLPAAVFHEGGVGYEPATYIFGENPLQLANIARKIARLYIGLVRASKLGKS
ncbi:MAG: hypothetical protein NXY59_07660 [Aigarchaeota archaeon]|nr:hypothetical protein [Candidatus Pelearchaeum maunauluense]